ncbi:MAG TPA: glycosyltransferase [Nitrospiraceae bacterium]|nr:glycosyltransferase [Nitrospiraceae bacterium]
MKVLHLITALSAGGAELHLLTLCRHLKRRGVTVVVVCLRELVKGSKSLRPDLEREGIRTVNLQAGAAYDWRFLTRLTRLFREERPDILHTHLPRADFAGTILHLLYPSLPWICSVHAVYSRAFWSGKWALPLFDLTLRSPHAIIAISGAVKDWLVEERHIRPEKVTVVHYGIEPERFTQPAQALRRIWGLNGQAVIGSVGRLEHEKGHEVLIRAMSAICDRVPDACLLIAGSDPWRYGEELQSIIDGMDVGDRVRLIGFQEDVPSFLHALDVFAFASRSEGFGQVIIEAMAAGRPVVANRIPPMTEIVVDGETGLLVEPDNRHALAEAIRWLLTHPDDGKRMGARGRDRVYKHFSVERMGDATFELYRTCA